MDLSADAVPPPDEDPLAADPPDAEPLAASLADRLTGLTFTGRTPEEVTALLIDETVAWGERQGWRVYRRAASVFPLPPPYAHRHSFVDVACARPHGHAPVVVEVDHGDRRRSVEKLRAEIAAGRIGIWVRWGTRRTDPPPPPVRTVTIPVTVAPGPDPKTRLYSRTPAVADRPAPRHTGAVPRADAQTGLFPDGGSSPVGGQSRA